MTAPEVRTPRVPAEANAMESEQSPIVPPSGPDCKSVAAIIAALQLKGHQVHELAGGEFLVTRWGMTRALPDVRALVAFARQVLGVRL